jgi:hypothetical protein
MAIETIARSAMTAFLQVMSRCWRQTKSHMVRHKFEVLHPLPPGVHLIRMTQYRRMQSKNWITMVSMKHA